MEFLGMGNGEELANALYGGAAIPVHP